MLVSGRTVRGVSGTTAKAGRLATGSQFHNWRRANGWAPVGSACDNQVSKDATTTIEAARDFLPWVKGN